MDKEILEQLKEEDKTFLESIKVKISDNVNTLDSVCNFVVERVGKENLSDFAELNVEEKVQTCLDHLAISLVSGDLKKKDIEELFQKK